MKRTRFSEEQIAFALRQVEGGASVKELCRKMQISEQTFYRWKKKFGGLGVAEVRRLKVLEQENRDLKPWRRHYNGERPHSALGDLTP
jgi:putative transposase